VQDKAYAYAQAIEEYTQEGSEPRRLSVTTTFADDLVSQTRYDELGAPSTSYVQADGFGSTRLLTDENGAVTDAIDYDAFGNVIARSGTTDIDHLYRGEALDPNTGFYYLRARYYGPSNGRFLNQDTFAGYNTDPRSLHKYAYTHNDPVNGMDPSGHMTMAGTLSTLNTLSNLYTVANISFQFAVGNYAGGAGMIAEEIVYSKLGGAFGKRVAELSKSQVALFNRVFSRGIPKLRLNEIANSRALRHNLKAVGVKAPQGSQAHHIVGQVSGIGRRTQAKLKALGIDLNSLLTLTQN